MEHFHDSIVDSAVPTIQINRTSSLDNGPAKYHVGLLTLSTDHLMEHEFIRMIPDTDVSFHATRIKSLNPVTIDNLKTMASQITDAAALLSINRLDAVGYYCTSGTTAIGDDAIFNAIHAVRPGVPITTPIGGAIAGMCRLGVQKISLVTPYVDSVNQMMRRYLEGAGFHVLNIASFCMESDLEMYRLSPEEIRAAVIAHTHENADGTFVSCTAIRAAETVDAVEQALERPVVTAGQAFFWQLLRSAGYMRPIDGYGELCRL